MNKEAFSKWLRTIKKLDDGTCKARIANCLRIEKYYGDLDEIYEHNQYLSLMKDLTYSTKDNTNDIPPKHKIPIEGNKYTGTQTLRNALRLFIEFKENKLLSEIKTMPDVVPDEHDGSYELIKETINSLANTPTDRLDVPDLELLYFMAVGTWKGGEKFRLEKIKKSNLPIEEKERLTAAFNRVIVKAKKHEYQNIVGQWSVGMFGTGFYSFKSDKENAQKFLSLCIEISQVDNEDNILNMAEEALKTGIKGMQTAAASIILHCLKPNVFPIINNGMVEAAVLLESEGVTLAKPKELTSYIQNARSIKEFRDEKCQFRNFRALDMKFWDVSESKADEEDDFDSGLATDESIYDEDIGIAKEQWLAMLTDNGVFKGKDRKLMLHIYNSGGQATATELAAATGLHPSSFNAPVVALARRVANHTKCHVPKRPDGKERWWNVLFNGRYKDNGQFNWILRDGLKAAVSEIHQQLKGLIASDPEENGQVRETEINYWWLNASPKIWSFNNIEIGQSVHYTSINENGNRRKIFKNFEDVKEGDLVIGYESYPVKAIVAICRIARAHDGESIKVEKLENLINPIEYSRLTAIEELKDMEYFKTPRGSLFRLTKQEFDEIMDIIREETPASSAASTSSYTKEDFLEEVFMDEEQYDQICGLLKYKKNIILQGAPGVGKTFVAKRLAYSMMKERDDNRVEMVQFHQSYSYEDFIMGYRPEEQGFKLRYGIFYRFCKKAQNDPTRAYYFIIDEINRGNLSKIFGELLMLIEADKRGDTYAVPLTYTESKFYVPKNVYIIGTMNTADRSLAMIDYALRRRFCFIDMEAAFNNLNFKGFIENKNNELAAIIVDRISKLNLAIESDSSLGKGFCIGHSYFCTKEDTMTIDDYENIIRYEVIPQLSEYWFDEPDKVREWTTRLLG